MTPRSGESRREENDPSRRSLSKTDNAGSAPLAGSRRGSRAVQPMSARHLLDEAHAAGMSREVMAAGLIATALAQAVDEWASYGEEAASAERANDDVLAADATTYQTNTYYRAFGLADALGILIDRPAIDLLSETIERVVERRPVQSASGSRTPGTSPPMIDLERAQPSSCEQGRPPTGHLSADELRRAFELEILGWP